MNSAAATSPAKGRERRTSSLGLSGTVFGVCQRNRLLSIFFFFITYIHKESVLSENGVLVSHRDAK